MREILNAILILLLSHLFRFLAKLDMFHYQAPLLLPILLFQWSQQQTVLSNYSIHQAHNLY